VKILDAFLKVAASLRVDNPNDQLCCVYVRATLAAAYGEAVVARAPVNLWHLWPETRDPWGPVTAALRAGVATAPPAPAHPVRGAWHIVQGWRGTPFAPGVLGHTFLWYEAPDASSGLLLDSADKRAPDGGIVDTIEDGPAATPTTWAAVQARYRGGIAVGVLS
jgi:hypothetical protein